MGAQWTEFPLCWIVAFSISDWNQREKVPEAGPDQLPVVVSCMF